MELIRLTGRAYHLHGGSNAGLILCDGRAAVIDTGLDRDAAKKILRHTETLGARVAAIVVTHAHADHFGGAALLRSRTGAPVYASPLEAAVIANPLLEPLYLFSGAAPPAELRHKFTLGEACPVDRLLVAGEFEAGGVRLRAISAPGHAPEQMMVAGGGVCFAADALFSPEILRKHGIPFYCDIARARATLGELAALEGQYEQFVPGHGPAVPVLAAWLDENAARIDEIMAAVEASLAAGAETAGVETDAIVRLALARLGVAPAGPALYWLARTTLLSCLSALQARGRAVVRVVENRLLWESA
jgi:glyoxylase-like metal-dependent hydrolase (beta-lactamase superfamily II)